MFRRIRFRRITLGIVWVSFVTYAVFLAPPNQADTGLLIQRLASGNWDGINPAIVALFNAMGIWPLIYACLTLSDGHGQRAIAWPFAVGAFGLGAFSLLPYLIWRQPKPDNQPPLSRLLIVLESRWLGLLIVIGSLLLCGYGFSAGNWGDFIQQWQTNRFIHVMGLDFCLLWLLIPTLLGDDMARRGTHNLWLLALFTALPLIGAGLYLSLRPPLSVTEGIATAP